MLRVAWLYPLPKASIRAAQLRGEDPDQLSGIDYMGRFGILPELIDPCPFPLNPLAGQHSIYSGLDVARALHVLRNADRYDAVLCVGESSAFFILMLRRLFGLRAPVVIWDPALGGDWRVRNWILNYVLPRADATFVVGSNQARFLQSRFGSGINTAVLHHWVDTDYFQSHQTRLGDYVASVGNDTARDYALLVEACRGLDISVRIKTSCRYRVPADAPANVSILTGRLSFQALREFYAAARFVVVPMHNVIHACGVNSLLEAMAMSKATIVSGSDGIRAFVIDGETCLVTPPDDVDALRSAISRLWRDNSLAGRLGRKARLVAENCFASPIFAEKLARAIREACRRQIT